jgi:hypothetical protein
MIEVIPFDLNLDGNFCDEIYKYILDILATTKRIVLIINSNCYRD